MQLTRRQLRKLIKENIRTSAFGDRVYLEILRFMKDKVFIFENFKTIQVNPNSDSWDNNKLRDMVNKSNLGSSVSAFFYASPKWMRNDSRITKSMKDAYDLNKKKGGFIFHMKPEKISTILSEFKKDVIQTRLKSDDYKKITKQLLNMFTPGGHPLTFIVFASPWHGGRGAGTASGNAIYLKPRLVGLYHSEDETALPTDAKSAFAEIIKRRIHRVLYHEFVHVIDGITEIFDDQHEKDQKVMRAYNANIRKTEEDKEAYHTFYASKLSEINARLITAFAAFEDIDLEARHNAIATSYKEYQKNKITLLELSKVINEKFNDIRDANSFLNYYKTNIGEFLTKDRRYYDFIKDQELQEHVDNRIKNYFKSEVKPNRKWRYCAIISDKVESMMQDPLSNVSKI